MAGDHGGKAIRLLPASPARRVPAGAAEDVTVGGEDEFFGGGHGARIVPRRLGPRLPSLAEVVGRSKGKTGGARAANSAPPGCLPGLRCHYPRCMPVTCNG